VPSRLDRTRFCTASANASPALALTSVGPTIRPVETDSELVHRLRTGDEHAFVLLVQRYQIPMLRLATSMVNNHAVAEEAVQDTWMGVARGIERFEARSSLKTWLFRILVNRVRSAHASEERRTSRRTPSVDPTFFDTLGQWAEPVAPWDEDVEDRIVASSLAPALRAALDRLPSRQREVLLLRDVECLTSEEACDVLGIRPGNQRILLHRGRAALREMLAAHMRKA
jgi:RNA polymerase sigma-70 factor, ECF subfamily